MVVTELKEYIYNEDKISLILLNLGCGNIFYHKDKEYYSCSHADGDNPMAINIRNNSYLNYRSWTRGVTYEDGQDLISLVEYTKGLNFVESLKWIHEILGLRYSIAKPHDDLNKKNLKQETLSIFTKHLTCNKPVDVTDIEVLDESVLDEYTPIEYIDWLKEGIVPNTCDKFGIMYSYKRHRIIIPHRYWLTGELIGNNARTVIKGYNELGISKYHFSKGFNKSINLYGLWENYNSIIRKGIVVVVEAEKSVLKRHSMFDETLVSLGGKFLSEEQKRILIGLNTEIVIALDKDVCVDEIRHMCEKFYGVRKVSYIYDSDNVLNNKDSPVDKGDDVYRLLLKNRIVYDENEHIQYLNGLNNKYE